MPLVSVVMPVYNGATYLEAAVRSVLDQSMRDLELVVVDDGSSDDSLSILERLADGDTRVRIESLATNQGHHVASNRALELAKGELIARHDQDDLLMSAWLEHATKFLGARADVGLLGGAHRELRGAHVDRLAIAPAHHTEIRASLVFKNVFCHPGVVVRSKLRDTGEFEYRDFAGPQDYDLWVRLLGFTRAANLAEQAVLYRRHSTTMSGAFASQMPTEVERISDRQLEELLGSSVPDLEGRRAMRRLWRGHIEPGDLRHLDEMRMVFDRLRDLPFMDSAALKDVREAWVRRVMSTSLRHYRRPPWHLVRTEPAGATKWFWMGLMRSANGPASAGEVPNDGCEPGARAALRSPAPTASQTHPGRAGHVGETETSHTVSVVVCTWNRARILHDCLKFLCRQSLDRGLFEIVVVDDGSDDDTSGVVEEFVSAGHPVVYIHQNHAGLNAARNRGIAGSTGDVIVFHDDDQLAPDRYLETVRDLLCGRPDLDGVGGPVRDYESSGVRLCRACSWSSTDVDTEHEEPRSGLLGGNMAIRRRTFDAVGLFNERLSGSGDETEWFARAAEARFLFVPDAWVWHRRDWITWTEMSRMGFRQGQSIPLALALQGERYRLRPLLAAKQLAHAFRFRCGRGLWHFCRSAGALWGYVKLRARRDHPYVAPGKVDQTC